MEDCVFCDLLGMDKAHYEGYGVYSFEPLNPVTPGHRLFVPFVHVILPHELTGITGNVFSSAAQYAGSAGGDYNLIVNAGPDASQTIKHLHVHYVPRRPDDGLKLPWTEQHAKARYEG